MNAQASGTFLIGGDLPVHRLGFGAMRITGPGVWGPPEDRKEALAVLRRAVDLGVNLIDTAESYGPYVSEELIAEALHPYPADLVIATKAGFDRSGPNRWEVNGRPERLREGLDGSLKRLRVDRIDLYQLHRIDPDVPLDEQLGFFADAQKEGKVRHFGLSEVTVEQIEEARKQITVTTVQNRYNLGDREWESVVDYCDREGIGFIPWYPLNVGKLPVSSAEAIAWLLARTPVMLPIPGTSKVKHLEENMKGATAQPPEV
jgi:aryl-alcohol dehydrogenase-like predicted oxidoreductase